MTRTPKGDDSYSDKEAQRRFRAALRGGLSTPPKPLAEIRVGKSKTKRAKKRT